MFESLQGKVLAQKSTVTYPVGPPFAWNGRPKYPMVYPLHIRLSYRVFIITKIETRIGYELV